MRVGDVRAAEGLWKRVACLRRQAIKLRIVARAGNGAHVDDALNIVRFEKRDKIIERAIGMADGENERLRAADRLFASLFGNFSASSFAKFCVHGRNPFCGSRPRGMVETDICFFGPFFLLVSSIVLRVDCNFPFRARS